MALPPGGLVLERDRELDLLERCLQRAQYGSGSALALEGPAGIGKTVLLERARERGRKDGFRWLRARGAELEQEFAFGVVRQLVEPVLADASPAERDALLDGAPRLAATVLGLPGAGDGAAAAAPDPSFAVLHGLYWLCANLAAERPLALVVDDAHWADGASLRFLAFLLPRLEELHLAVLLTARPAEGGSREVLARIMLDPATQVASVGPLSRDGVARLIASTLGVEPEPAFVEACWDATGGTPFLVHTLLTALGEERVAPVSASARAVHGVASATLGRWASVRLERLGREAFDLGRAVAILERTSLDEAGRLAGLAPEQAAMAAQRLVGAGVLHMRPLEFVHPLLRAAVYGAVPGLERAEMHRRTARLLAHEQAAPSRVAEHLLVSNPAGDGWVVEQLRATAQAAIASGAPESAVAYLRRALIEPPSVEAAAPVLLELGRAEFNAGEIGWERHLEDALAAARDDTTWIGAGMLLASCLGYQQRLAEAVRVCDRVAAQLDDPDSELCWLIEATAIACGLLDAAVAPPMRDRAMALLAHATEVAAPRFVLAIGAYVSALINEPAPGAAELAHRALRAGPRPLPEPGDLAWFPTAVIVLVWTERFDEALSLLDAAAAEAYAVADGLLLPALLSERAWLAFLCGDLTAAEADARSLLEGHELLARPLHALLATGALVGALAERGEFADAEQALERVAGALQHPTQTAGAVFLTRGRLRVAQGRLAEALTDFYTVGDISTRTFGISPAYRPWRSEAALVHAALGEHERAHQLSSEEIELARAFGTPRALGVALRAAGVVAGAEGGEPLLREAVAVLDSPPTRLQQAYAQADLGAFLRRGDRLVEARQLLRLALDTAHRAGSHVLALHAETELRASGARPRRVVITGLEALTASERRIAELAAGGLTNREIAQRLFVTARTVEGHLTSVFSKLAIRARTELPEVLGRLAPA